MMSRLPRLLAFAILFPALSADLAASYRIGPETPVSPIVVGPTDTSGSRSSASFDGNNFVVVWEDTRSDTGEVYAARVTLAGEVLDPLGIPFGLPGTSVSQPHVVWTGAGHLILATAVSWEAPSTYVRSRYVTRLSVDGSVIEGFPSVSRGVQSGALVSFNGGAVAFRELDGELLVDRLDSSGVLIETATTGVGAWWFGGAAASADRILTLRSTTQSVEGWLLDEELKIKGPITVATTTSIARASVASDGKDFLAIWNDAGLIIARRVSRAGVLGDPMVLTSDAAEWTTPTAAWAGDRYIVAWGTDDGGRITELGGGVQPSLTLRSPSPAPRLDTLRVSGSGNSVIATWYADDVEGASLYAQILAPIVSPAILISRAAATQTAPDIRAEDTKFEVTWTEGRSRWLRTPNALLSTTAAVHPASPASTQASATPGYAIAGGSVLAAARGEVVAWREISLNRTHSGPEHYAIRVRRSGTRTLATDRSFTSDPNVTAGAEVVLVTWAESDGIAITILDHSASTIAEWKLTTPPPFEHQIMREVSSPRAQWDGERFLIVWSLQEVAGPSFKGQVFATFVEPDGTVSPSVVIEPSAGVEPSVAWNGAEYLVVWSGFQTPRGYRARIESARLSRRGDVLSRTTLDVHHGSHTASRAVWARDHFIVTWLHSDDPLQILDDGSRRIRGARVTAAGELAGTFEVAAAPFGIWANSLAATDDGKVAVAYVRPDERAGGVHRVFYRILQTPRRMRAVRR